MSKNVYIYNSKAYKCINYENVPEGRYKLFFHFGYSLISVDKLENLIYYFEDGEYEHNEIYNFEVKYDIEIPDVNDENIGKLKNNNTAWKYNFICEIDNGYKEFFIEAPLNDKNNKRYPLYFSNYITNLKPYREYTITNFTKSKYDYGIIISEKWTKCLHSETNKYYVNKKVIDILETYFKCEKDKIYCMYNNKKSIAKLTLITGDELITENGSKLLQSLKLEIGNKKFTFYINDINTINYEKEDKYCFLVMHIYNNSLYNNLIYGYEFKKDKYYCLKFEERLILNNIDREIARNFQMMIKQDCYTYLLSNNAMCGMIINIDKYKNITTKLVKLNDKCFEELLDISLLKPLSEWNINNNPHEIYEFDSIVEGFDDDNNQK